MNGSKTDDKVLLIGIGNSSRSDDALGWLFADQIAGLIGFDVEYRYQLQIEDAQMVSEHDTVIFVDASREKFESGFSFGPCKPVNSFSFSTHRVEPGSLLWLSRELYGKLPLTFVMAIEGTDWELHEGLSPSAQQNFDRSIRFFKKWLRLSEQLRVRKQQKDSVAS